MSNKLIFVLFSGLILSACTGTLSTKCNDTEEKRIVVYVSYEKMEYGFNECEVSFGEQKKNVTEKGMVRWALSKGAKGFTMHPSFKYGALMLGEYPHPCKSPSSESWPLYLQSKQIF